MKLVTFLRQGRERTGAVLDDGRILAFHAADPDLDVDMLTLIRRQDELLPRVRDLAARPPGAPDPLPVGAAGGGVHGAVKGLVPGAGVWPYGIKGNQPPKG